ncbi:MAG: glycoside hydrolase family 76 protein [Bacteroidales bacterium]|nr:glycoside hydrolase family 76 protein [Bacteroidales bacterium]
MKRITGIILSVTCLAACGIFPSCGKENTTPDTPEKGKEEPTENVATSERNIERAIKLTEAGIKNYFNEADGYAMYRYYNPYNETHQGNEIGSVWMYTSSIEAVNAILKALDNEKAGGQTKLYSEWHDRYVSLLSKLVDGLKYYRGTFTLTSFTQTKEWTVYGVNRSKTADGASVAGIDNVYDDQQWLIRELIESYHLTGNQKYLDEAEYLTAYVLDGWDCTIKNGKERGGIPWGPGYYSKHSCSNGPMVSPLVWLAEIYSGKSDKTEWRYISSTDGTTRKTEQMNKSDYYLMFAKKIYDYQKANLLLASGVYTDNLNGPVIGGTIQYETVNGVKYRKPSDLADKNGPAISYNSGTMLSGAADLYRVTTEQTYLKDLQALNLNTFRYFAKKNQQKAGYYSYDITGFNNWFNGVLLRGYADAVNYDSTAKEHMDTFQQNLDYAWDNYLYSDLLPSSLLVGWNQDRTKNNLEGMFVFAFASEYAVMSRYISK